MSFWYLATPYSRYAAGIEHAWRDACTQAMILARAGVPVYSPIAYTHGLALSPAGHDPLDGEFWLRFDAPMIRAAMGLIVCRLPGWNESAGIAREIEAFARAAKPILHMEPGIVPPGVAATGEAGP